MNIRTEHRLKAAGALLIGFGSLAYLAVTAGRAHRHQVPVGPTSHRAATAHADRPAEAEQHLSRVDVQRASVVDEGDSSPALPDGSGPPPVPPSGSLALRDAFFDVAVKFEIPAELWQRADVRAAFIERCRLRSVIDLLDEHRALNRIEPPSPAMHPTLESMIVAAGADRIAADDLDTWDLVRKYDAQVSPFWRDGGVSDQHLSDPSAWALQERLCALDPFDPLISMIAERAGAE